jgi:hypothetical protein
VDALAAAGAPMQLRHGAPAKGSNTGGTGSGNNWGMGSVPNAGGQPVLTREPPWRGWRRPPPAPARAPAPTPRAAACCCGARRLQASGCGCGAGGHDRAAPSVPCGGAPRTTPPCRGGRRRCCGAGAPARGPAAATGVWRGRSGDESQGRGHAGMRAPGKCFWQHGAARRSGGGATRRRASREASYRPRTLRLAIKGRLTCSERPWEVGWGRGGPERGKARPPGLQGPPLTRSRDLSRSL